MAMRSINTRKLVSSTGEIDRGIKVTKNNVDTIAEWVMRKTKDWKRSEPGVEFVEAIHETKKLKDGSIKILDRVRVYTFKGWRVAQIGDIVALNSHTGKLYIIKPDQHHFFESVG